MNTLSTSDYKLVLFYIKYIPIIMFLLMFIHIGLLLMEINLGIADTIVGCAIIPSLLILSISKLLKFCWLHKSLTIYSLIVDLCINWEKYIGFGSLLYPLRILIFSIGIILLCLLLSKLRSYNTKCIKSKRLLIYVEAYKETVIKNN